MASATAPTKPLAWQSLYLRAGFLIIAGVVLFFTGNSKSALSLGVLSALLVLSGLSAHRFWRSSRQANNPDYWFLIAGLLDIAVGVGLLFYLSNPAKGIANMFGAWGVLVAITQAVAAMYTFLGVKDNSESGQDFTVVILHFVTALLGGGIAFMLIQRPAAEQSNQFSGFFPLVMGAISILLIRRLKADIELDQSQQAKS